MRGEGRTALWLKDETGIQETGVSNPPLPPMSYVTVEKSLNVAV